MKCMLLGESKQILKMENARERKRNVESLSGRIKGADLPSPQHQTPLMTNSILLSWNIATLSLFRGRHSREQGYSYGHSQRSRLFRGPYFFAHDFFPLGKLVRPPSFML